jgi:hypothetical protein
VLQLFLIAFCFLSAENEGMYHLGIIALKEKVLGDTPVGIFLADDLKSVL